MVFYSRLLRAVPAETTGGGGRIRGPLDFVPLDQVAGDIADAVLASCDEAVVSGKESTQVETMGVKNGGGGVTYVHHTGGTVMELATLREFHRGGRGGAVGGRLGGWAEKGAVRGRAVFWVDGQGRGSGVAPAACGLLPGRGVSEEGVGLPYISFTKGPR